MNDKPIIMQPWGVRAIFDGRKTQTRRVVPSKMLVNADMPRGESDVAEGYPFIPDKDGDFWALVDICPYGQPGDLLWVRETFRRYDGEDDDEYGYQSVGFASDDYPYHKAPGIQWRPSIHMPRWASRLTLRITDVRVERVKEITVADIEREGIVVGLYPGTDVSIDGELWQSGARKYVWAFAKLWDEINAKRGYSWADNPWVWVIEFEPVHANVDTVKEGAVASAI